MNTTFLTYQKSKKRKMADISELPKRLRLVINNLKTERERIVKVAARTILETLVNNTPVDTSKALSNWQASIGAPIDSTRNAIAEGKAGSTRSTSAAVAFALGEISINKFTVGSVIHITNNLPYIEGLNNGTISTQPGAFVEKAIQFADIVVKNQDLVL